MLWCLRYLDPCRSSDTFLTSITFSQKTSALKNVSNLCGYQRPARGVDPRDTHGQTACMVGDLLKNLAWEPGAFAFRGKHPRDPIHGICRWSRSIMVSGNSSQHLALDDHIRPIVDGSAFRRVIFHWISTKSASIIKPSSTGKRQKQSQNVFQTKDGTVWNVVLLNK